MKTQVPQELQALMALKQGMQTGQVQRVAPDGRTPTVAEQLTQQAEQSMAPPEPEAPDMPGMLPVAEQASQGMQVGMHQQEQEQNRMKELLERMANSRPDPAQQGIAQQAPDMNFADGGIVGYNGEEESFVEAPSEASGGGEEPRQIRVLTSDRDNMLRKIGRDRSIPLEERMAVVQRLLQMPPSGGEATINAPRGPEPVPAGGIAGERPASSAAALAAKLMGLSLDNKPLSAQEESARANDERAVREAYLKAQGLPANTFALQEEAMQRRQEAERQRQAEYEKAKGSRTGITSPGLSKALAAFASAPRRQAFARMGMSLANEREGFQKEDVAEMASRRKFEADMDQAKMLLMQGRIQEAMSMRDTAIARRKAEQAATNEQTKFEAEILRALYPPTMTAETADKDRLGRENVARIQAGARIAGAGGTGKVTDFTRRVEALTADYVRKGYSEDEALTMATREAMYSAGRLPAESRATTADEAAAEEEAKIAAFPFFGKPEYQAKLKAAYDAAIARRRASRPPTVPLPGSPAGAQPPAPGTMPPPPPGFVQDKR